MCVLNSKYLRNKIPTSELCYQLSDLSRKIDVVVQPVYVSKKIKGHFKPKEHKPPIAIKVKNSWR